MEKCQQNVKDKIVEIFSAKSRHDILHYIWLLLFPIYCYTAAIQYYV